MSEETFIPDQELIDFAEMFSFCFRTAAPGDFFSKNKKYRIEYVERIRDTLSLKPINTIARVGLESGKIQLDKTLLDEEPADFCFFLIIWCAAQFKLQNEINSDTAAINYYTTTGRSIYFLYKRFSDFLKTRTNPANDLRVVNAGQLLLPHIPQNANPEI